MTMRPNAKKLSTGVLALTAVAIWVPQLLTGVVKPAEPAAPAVDEPDTDMPPLGAEIDIDMPPPAGETHETPGVEVESETQRSDDLAGQLDHAGATLRELSSASERVDLDELIETYQMAAGGGAVPTGSPLDDHDGPRAPGTTNGHAAPFSTERILKAVIHGESGAVALVDSSVVRVGDTLAGGVSVAAIEPRRVLLEAAGQSRWLHLPPFAPRPAFSAGGVDEDGGADPQTSGDALPTEGDAQALLGGEAAAQPETTP